MFVQLRADGRAADPAYLRSNGHTFVAPSDIPIVEGDEKPMSLTKEKIAEFLQFYAQAAKNALEAGFDGVEVHDISSMFLPINLRFDLLCSCTMQMDIVSCVRVAEPKTRPVLCFVLSNTSTRSVFG